MPDGFTDADFDDGGVGRGRRSRLLDDAGFDRPIYTNYAMPFRTFPPDVPDDNPTGCYRTRFTVPDDWRDRRVVLHIGGAESVLRVWVNGTRGRHEQGLAARSRVRRHRARAVRREQLLAAEVVRWSDASFVEDQDQWWHAGIHREVFLYSTPRTFLADVHATASLTADPATGTLDLQVGVDFDEARARRRLDRRRALRGRGGTAPSTPPSSAARCRAAARRTGSAATPCACTREVADVTPWSAEEPNRYRLQVALLDPDGNLHDTATTGSGSAGSRSWVATSWSTASPCCSAASTATTSIRTPAGSSRSSRCAPTWC